MPPHEKEKRFGDEREKYGFNGIVDDDLSVVHQFGPAGFDAGQRVAGDECQLERAALGRRTGADADFILHDYFQSEQRKTDPQIWNGEADGDFRRDDALALLGFSLAKNYAFLLLMAVPLGLGAGAVDAGLNNYVALHCEAKHMSWLHCFWGIGTIIGPMILSAVLRAGGSWATAIARWG